MIDTFLSEYKRDFEDLAAKVLSGGLSPHGFYQAAASQLEVLHRVSPENASYASRLAEFHHLDGNLRKAGEHYRQTLEIDLPRQATDDEIRRIRRYCPLLLTNPRECFPLKDIVAIHHPTEPLIGYHLFWEDDYDFPDDNEPCDHEEVWIRYDPAEETVTGVYCWFHSRVLESAAAAAEAQANGQRAVIRVEWGKHGSLLKGWEDMREPMTGMTITEWLRRTHAEVAAGGRLPDHPLKRFWPTGFEGSFEDYIDFSASVDPLHLLDRKPLMLKTQWVNAALFTQCMLYNFHPKMEWPDRFFNS